MQMNHENRLLLLALKTLGLGLGPKPKKQPAVNSKQHVWMIRRTRPDCFLCHPLQNAVPDPAQVHRDRPIAKRHTDKQPASQPGKQKELTV